PAIRFERQVAAGSDLDRGGQDVAYRVVQESISNAVRHGQPSTIRITVTDGTDHTEVCVEDDGGGIKPGASGGMSLGHMGLAGMEERLRTLHGRLTVEETEAQGVRVCAFLPKTR